MAEDKNLCWSILPPPQRRLWAEMFQVPETFTLYGGTAIALYLGHRQSQDFDFFGNLPFEPRELIEKIPFLQDAEVLQSAANTLTCIVEREGEPVKVSFFGLPHLGQVEDPYIVKDTGLHIASLIDLAGTKVVTVQQRATVKDYTDIAAMLERGDVDLPSALSAASIIYGKGFNPQITLKALVYFDDVKELTSRQRDILVGAVDAVDLDKLPQLKPVRRYAGRKK